MPFTAAYFQRLAQIFPLVGREPRNGYAAEIAACHGGFDPNKDDRARAPIPVSRAPAGSCLGPDVSHCLRCQGCQPFPYVLSPVPFHFKTARFVTHKELPLTPLTPLVNFDACNGLIAVFLPSRPDLLQLRQAIIECLEKGRPFRVIN